MAILTTQQMIDTIFTANQRVFVSEGSRMVTVTDTLLLDGKVIKGQNTRYVDGIENSEITEYSDFNLVRKQLDDAPLAVDLRIEHEHKTNSNPSWQQPIIATKTPDGWMIHA